MSQLFNETPDGVALLQALRNVTREHMRLLARTHDCAADDTKSVVCVEAALHQMAKHNFKQNNPL